jgi:hypothetical protein
VAVVPMRRRASTEGDIPTGEALSPSAAGLPASEAGTRIAVGDEIARHLLNSGEHAVTLPSVDKIAMEHCGDAQRSRADPGVSGARSWDDDIQPCSGDDWR